MVFPKVKKCCWCIPLDTGCGILGLLSLAACIASLTLCAVKLPEHRRQQNEDNLILLSMTMFASLSAVSNLLVLVGMAMKRSSFLMMSVLSNSVFIACIILVSVVTCLFSPALKPYLQHPGNVALVVFLLIGAIVYSIYYLTIVNSMYSKMKCDYSDSAIPV